MSDSAEQLNLFDIRTEFPQPAPDRIHAVELKAIEIANSFGVQVRCIRWKNNRRVMASVGKNGYLNLNVIYQRAKENDLRALAIVLAGKARKQDQKRFQKFIEDHLPRELGVGKSRLIILPPDGLFHDLNKALETVLPLLDKPLYPMPQVGWSPVRVGRRGITWGTHRNIAEGPLVLVNAVLDAVKVPNCVVEHIVWHELCHQVVPPVPNGNGRRRVHSAEFRKMETKYPRFREAEKWEEGNIVYLIRQHYRRRR